MPEATPSVLEVLMSSMGALPAFDIAYLSPTGTVKDRVLKHDLLHVLLIDREWPVAFRFEDEYCAAVVQAVLTRDSRVSARSVSGDGPTATGRVPSLEEIWEVTVPSVVGFLEYTLPRLGLRVPDDFRLPDMEFVGEYYRLGLSFAAEFRAELGEDYASIPAAVLKDVPFECVARSFRRAAAEHRRTEPA
ncbi:hypothetical protein J0910_14360 [Nocardiopsis sp. CNT-189]|uniref:hypothetical protein n=1 Tax=Nocardiopsis oceanisediminis TaxID=2816862 RepID=UPI003B2BF669